MLTHKIFYKKYGIRRLSKLISSEKFPIQEYPRNSIFHFLNLHDDESKDIDTTLPWLVESKRKVLIDFIDELKEVKGKVRRKTTPIKLLIKKWLIKNKHFKYVKDVYKSSSNPLDILVTNFNYLDELYLYAKTPMSSYYKWYNEFNTLIDYINKVALDSDRNQFITFNVPDTIPSISILNMFKDREDVSMLKIFQDNEMLVVRELYLWIIEETKDSSVFSNLNNKALAKLNIVFKNNEGYKSVLNLGYLNSFIQGRDNLTEFNEITQADDKVVAKYFLKYLLDVQAVSEVNEDENEEFLDQDLDDDSKELLDELNKKEKESLNTTNKDVDESLNILEKVNANFIKKEDGTKIVLKSEEELVVDITKSKSSEEQALLDAKERLERGEIKAADYRSIEKSINEYKNKTNPYGGNETIEQFKVITEDDIKLDEEAININASELVKDTSMTKSTLRSYDDKYIKSVLKKDIIACISDIQKAGVIIKDHKVEVHKSVVNEYEEHTIKVKPIDGAASTIKVRLPIVDENGFMKINGSTYVMRKQRVDIPIRKINPTTVSLFSYYGKSFIYRSSKKADNSIDWLVKQINLLGLEPNNYIHSINPANVYDNNFKAPFIYNALSQSFRSLEAGDKTLIFDHKERLELSDSELIKKLEGDKYRVCGIDGKGNLILVDYSNIFYLRKEGKLEKIGNIYYLTKIERSKSPIDITELKIFKKTIPLGLVLGYYLGFRNLIKLLGAEYKIEESSRTRIESNQYKISFEDITYIFDKDDIKSSLILGGFTKFKNIIKSYKSEDFDKKDIYFNILSSKGFTTIYLRELDNLKQLFIDPITKSILESFNEPTTYEGLLIRANEMLLDYNHPDSQDTSYMRVRGYERMAGFIYSSLSTGIRSFKARNISGKSKIDIGHFEIFNSIASDNSMKIVEDTNPIQNLKEMEVVTYSGAGGRSSETLNESSRAYHINDVGVISEATVDSSSVGVNAYLSPNAKLNNVRGITDGGKGIENSNLLSTSALLSPGAIHDDPKRVNFISIQNSHTISTEGYRQPYVRTGYEYIVPKRTSKTFSYSAKMKGIVEDINEDGIIILYEDGTKEGVELGTVYGKAEGAVYPHKIVPNVKKGQKFNKDHVIAFNSKFFEKDILDPSSIVLKTGFTVRTALYESDQTFEDSSSISKKVADKLTTNLIKTKEIVVNFNQNILDPVKEGSTIVPNQEYMIIEDEITSDIGGFSSDSLKALSRLSAQTPKSHYNGVIDKIEVLYNGDKKDMSPGLKKLADASDRELSKKFKSTGKEVLTGKVNSDYRVSGNPLLPNTAVITIYVSVVNTPNVGDKGVFGNQLKSVFGEVMEYNMTTESGLEIDAVFGFRSIAARIVLSPTIMGTTISLLKVIAKKSLEIYR